MGAQEDYKNLFRKIKRTGSENLMKWMDGTDFFSAPASTRFHECCEGGLCAHSVNVYGQLRRLVTACELDVTEDTMLTVSLLHDLCKIGCYKTEMRNRKNELGQWEKVPFYTFQEDNAFGGHGSKSVYIIQCFMRLTFEEAAAINCHMGVENGNFSVNDAYRQYPLAFLLHTADMASTIPGLDIRGFGECGHEGE